MPKTLSTLLVYYLSWLLLLFSACANETLEDEEVIIDPVPGGTKILEASEQRSGDPQAGYDYLVYGNYISAGIPYDIFTQVLGGNTENKLSRTGDNADIPFDYTAVDAFNGVRVVAPNCLQCHAGEINGEFIVGLGNINTDFTIDQSEAIPLASFAIELAYGSNSPEWNAYEPFARATEATGPYLLVENKGTNPADKIAAVLAAHRDPFSLEWRDAAYVIPDEVVPTDVPPWWVLKKKNAMFYAGIGRGDFARIMMASSLLTMRDSTKAREVDERFNDVQAYINSLEAPAYPFDIDMDLAAEGEQLFTSNCTSCHGTYGVQETYPNLLVGLDVVKTDPMLSDVYESDQFRSFRDWLNEGWFGEAPNAAQIVAEGGYVAPPLDGIWASAPYLHNGSVPTIEDLLNSSQRPQYWKWSFDSRDYDPEKLGWQYSLETEKGDDETYDATVPGYTNVGHTFGDLFSEQERKAVIEYLKTL